jgi:hypothetical protein
MFRKAVINKFFGAVLEAEHLRKDNTNIFE